MNTTSISRARLALLPLLGFLAIIPTAAGELQPVEISPSGASGSGPQIASDGAGNVVAIWRELDGDSSWIRAAFRPAGDDWGSSKRISVGAASTESPDLAMDRPGNAVAVWQSSSGHDSVVKAALRPANEQWSAPEDLSAADEPAFNAHVAVEAGHAVAVWVVLHKRRTVVVSSSRGIDGAWSAPETVSGPVGNSFAPTVALDDKGGAIAAWQWWDGANRVVVAATRSGGGSWSPPEELSIPSRNASHQQLVMDADGNALVGWIRGNGVSTAAQVVSRPAGKSWGPPTNLSNRGGNASGLDLAMTRGGDAAAAWKQGSPSSNLWSAFRRADASHWSDRVAVTSGWVGLQADIALDPQGNATAVWSSSATVSASFKPEGKPWQDDYLLSHYEDFAVYPAVAMHRPRTAMAVWVRSGDEDDRIQSVLYDIDTSAKEAEPGDEGDGGDEGDDGGDEGEQFRGTAQADKLVGTPGNDVFYGLGGNDTIDGRGGRDVAYGGPGNDRIVGGRGADRLFGGPGRDQISGGRGRDLLVGGPGSDRIAGGRGVDRLLGDAGRDRLSGGRGGDVLVGGGGRDVLRGGPGDDTLRARDRLADTASGGRGLDQYWLDRWLDHARSIESRLR